MTGAEGSVTLVDLAGSEHRIDAGPLLQAGCGQGLSLSLRCKLQFQPGRTSHKQFSRFMIPHSEMPPLKTDPEIGD